MYWRLFEKKEVWPRGEKSTQRNVRTRKLWCENTFSESKRSRPGRTFRLICDVSIYRSSLATGREKRTYTEDVLTDTRADGRVFTNRWQRQVATLKTKLQKRHLVTVERQKENEKARTQQHATTDTNEKKKKMSRRQAERLAKEVCKVRPIEWGGKKRKSSLGPCFIHGIRPALRTAASGARVLAWRQAGVSRVQTQTRKPAPIRNDALWGKTNKSPNVFSACAGKLGIIRQATWTVRFHARVGPDYKKIRQTTQLRGSIQTNGRQ